VSDIPQDLLYTEDHEYLKPAGEPDVVLVGITDFAQGRAGRRRLRRAAKGGRKFKKHDVFGTIEAVKAVSELFAPVSGEVVAVNRPPGCRARAGEQQSLRRRLDGEASHDRSLREGHAARRLAYSAKLG
jgi:hypothetical protein